MGAASGKAPVSGWERLLPHGRGRLSDARLNKAPAAALGKREQLNDASRGTSRFRLLELCRAKRVPPPPSRSAVGSSRRRVSPRRATAVDQLYAGWETAAIFGGNATLRNCAGPLPI